MESAVLSECFPDPSVLSAVNEKGHLPNEVRDTVLRKCRMKSDNRNCFECGARSPTWCSVTFGVYLCLDCSGNHRRKGTHISFVRSVDMDKFAPDQLLQMVLGGNAKAGNYFKDSGMGRWSSSGKAVDFTCNNAIKYKNDLVKSVKAACATIGVAEEVEAAHAAAALAAEAGDAPVEAAAQDAPPAPTVTWTVGQRIQYRESGNPTWKWGHVTHCKPLKVDYAARPEIRITPAGTVLDTEAQRVIAFAQAAHNAAVAAPAAAAKAAVKPAPVPVAAAPKVVAAPKAATASTNMVIRGVRPATTTPSAPVGGYPAAVAKSAAGKELDLTDDFGDIKDMMKAKSPKASPKNGPAPAPAGDAAKPVSPLAAPAPEPVKKVVDDEFDWDF